MADLESLYNKNVGTSNTKENPSVDLNSLYDKNVGQSKPVATKVSNDNSKSKPLMSPNELISVLRSVGREVSNPMAIATGRNYINAATQASAYIRESNERNLAPMLGIDKLSDKPLPGMNKIGSLLPESVPFLPNVATGGRDILSQIPIRKPIQNLSPQGIGKAILGELVDPNNWAAVMMGSSKPNVGKLTSQASKLESKATRMATNLIQPNIKELTKSVNRGFTLPAISESIQVMKTAKSLGELHGHLKEAVTKATTERNNILAHYNKPIDQSHILSSMGNFANEESAKGVRKKSFMRMLDQTLAQEVDYLKANPTIDIATAQARKELLQDLTDPILSKRAMGTLTERESADLLALDTIRRAYKESIIKALPSDQAHAVSSLNSQLEGLIDAKNAVAERVAYSMSDKDPSIAGRAFSSIGLSPKLGVAKAVGREILERTEVSHATNKIIRLRDEAKFLRHIAQTSDGLSRGRKIPLTLLAIRGYRKSIVEEEKK